MFKKTSYVLFCSNTPSVNIDITINRVHIDRVLVAKFLGVLIDDRLQVLNLNFQRVLPYYTFLFHRSHALQFVDLVKFKTVVFMFKAYRCKLPVNVQNHFMKRDISTIARLIINP